MKLRIDGPLDFTWKKPPWVGAPSGSILRVQKSVNYKKGWPENFTTICFTSIISYSNANNKLGWLFKRLIEYEY